MSEGTHSNDVTVIETVASEPSNPESNMATTTPSKKRSIMPVVAGTTILLVVAGIWLQFFHANPAVSQTVPEPNAGRANLGGTPQVMARVNNQTINYDEVAKECVERHGSEILDNLVNRMIIQQACDQHGITISQAEIVKEVNETAKKFNLPVESWYTMLQSNRGLTRDQYHRDIIWPMIALKKLAGQKITVTEEDMRVGFERDYGPRVKARLILVEGNIRQANKIWEDCKANLDDFDRLARDHSADPNTRPLGGVIPPIRKHGGNKAIEDAAFRLRTGELSAVIHVAENRYVILKCEGQTEPVVDNIQAVWNDLFGQLQEEKTQVAVAKVFEEIKQNARVDNFLTRKSTQGRGTSPIQQATNIAPGPIQTQQQVIPAAN